ncbi:SpoIIIAH-like family protein [Anaerofilum sp. BX8]|uniref:SpoIIIAH-like family protein n=1 Tax=Anaerofilum hominis TaxID=2763016 RepID=A0A923I439_9FIRM|nr:SpoIIIAH-like family protein [Anaerofilum hominis]MBC5579933.1 SpoIIIAH-like family protein [Anaerofilum hominis]
MKSMLNRKKITLLTLVVALGVAVYLNWEYAKTGSADFGLTTGSSASTVQTAAQPNGDAGLEVQGEAESQPPAADKNYGDAQLVSLSTSGDSKYFDEARLTRSKTRDEALDTLQKSLKNSKLSDEEKKALTDQLSGIITSIAAEGEIENMVKAKGFVDCVAFLDGDKANITVKTKSDALTKSEVAQIRDIVIAKSDISAKNITVVEVK